MTNQVFQPYRDKLPSATGPNVLTATVAGMFIDHADDTPDPAVDDMLDDIASAARVPAAASAPTLSGKVVTTPGIFDCDNLVFTALTGDAVESLVIFERTGVENTSDLLAFYDTATGLPLTPTGGDVTVVFGTGLWQS